MFDVDHFKRLNDTYGDSAGHTALVELLQPGLSQTQHEAVMARLGREEMLVAVHDTALAQAAETAEHIRYSVTAHAIELRAGEAGPRDGLTRVAANTSVSDGVAP